MYTYVYIYIYIYIYIHSIYISIHQQLDHHLSLLAVEAAGVWQYIIYTDNLTNVRVRICVYSCIYHLSLLAVEAGHAY